MRDNYKTNKYNFIFNKYSLLPYSHLNLKQNINFMFIKENNNKQLAFNIPLIINAFIMQFTSRSLKTMQSFTGIVKTRLHQQKTN